MSNLDVLVHQADDILSGGPHAPAPVLAGLATAATEYRALYRDAAKRLAAADAQLATMRGIVDRVLEGWDADPVDRPYRWVRPGSEPEDMTPPEGAWFAAQARRRESVL